MRYLQYLLTSICFLLLPLQVGVAKSSPSLHYVSFTADELKNIQGHYSTIYGYLYIRVRGQNVSTQYDGKYIQLVKKSNGHFYPRYRFLWIFPIQIGNMSFTLKKMPKGKTQIIMHQNGKKRIVAQRFFAKPVPVAWKKRLGIYKASQLKGKTDIKKIRLAIQNGVLVAFSNNLNSPYPLIADSNWQLTSPSAGHNNKRTIKISLRKNDIILAFEQNKLLLQKQ